MTEAAGNHLAETQMLRTPVFVPIAVFSLALPAVAAGKDYPSAIVGLPVHSDNGVVIGRVSAVTRDRAGNVVSVEIPGLEPPSAASLRGAVIARNDASAQEARVIDLRPRNHLTVNQTSARQKTRLR
jgi:hypothetical protein